MSGRNRRRILQTVGMSSGVSAFSALTAANQDQKNNQEFDIDLQVTEFDQEVTRKKLQRAKQRQPVKEILEFVREGTASEFDYGEVKGHVATLNEAKYTVLKIPLTHPSEDHAEVIIRWTRNLIWDTNIEAKAIIGHTCYESDKKVIEADMPSEPSDHRLKTAQSPKRGEQNVVEKSERVKREINKKEEGVSTLDNKFPGVNCDFKKVIDGPDAGLVCEFISGLTLIGGGVITIVSKKAAKKAITTVALGEITSGSCKLFRVLTEATGGCVDKTTDLNVCLWGPNCCTNPFGCGRRAPGCDPPGGRIFIGEERFDCINN